MNIKTIYISVIFSMFLLLNSCGIYSFTGASLHPDAKTVSISYFPNHATLIQPTLSQVFTEGLKDRFVRQTNLALTEEQGHLNFEGVIKTYRTEPVAIQGDDKPAQNRLTIDVQVKYTNLLDDTQDFDSNFSRYADFDSNLTLQAVEDALIKEIVEQLTDDIFNKAVVNW